MADKKEKRTVESHPFNPGDKIAVHKASDAEIERNEERQPAAKPDSEVTVGKDGKLEFSGEPGTTYTLSNVPEKKKDDDEPEQPIRFLTVPVK